MTSLYQAIKAHTGQQAPALTKHLEAADIHDWKDLTKSRLYAFRDELTDNVANSSAKTYIAVLKALLDRYSDEADIPCKSYREFLKVKDEKPVKTYLTRKELAKLEMVSTKGEVEDYVLNEFLVSAYTGMRISDAEAVDTNNVQGEFLSYVSIKTKVHAVVPLRAGIADRIKWLQEHNTAVSLVGYNKAIRRLCKRAGINEEVKVFKAGKVVTGPKYQFISSHSGRISFCTCLAGVGAGIEEIRQMAGHTSSQMTERYIVPGSVELSAKAMTFFK